MPFGTLHYKARNLQQPEKWGSTVKQTTAAILSTKKHDKEPSTFSHWPLILGIYTIFTTNVSITTERFKIDIELKQTFFIPLTQKFTLEV